MAKRSLQRASQSRVFLIEDRAGATHTPQYQDFARVTGVTWSQGDITPVRVPDPRQYGRYITVDKIKGDPGLPTTTIEFRKARIVSEILKLTRKGCPIDVQVHIGQCEDPSDFNMGWEVIAVLEDVDITQYDTSELGALDGSQEAAVMETLSITAQDYYELNPIAFSAAAENDIVQEVIDVAICDSKVCGECGLPSDGCEHIFAIETPQGASPGLDTQIVYTRDAGASFDSATVNSLPANSAPSAMACAGPYLVVLSNDDGSLHYGYISDILDGVGSFTRVATGFVVGGEPNAIFSAGRTMSWIVGDGGYIYFSEDPTTGVQAQTSGDITSQNLLCISAADEENLIVGGATNALLLTRNGGTSWALISGPASQAAADIQAVAMVTKNLWYLGYSDGTLWYTQDGGVSFAQRLLPGALTEITAISFATQTCGYLAGVAGSTAKIERTISGGNSWYVLPETPGLTLPSAARINAIAACGDNPNLVWAGGYKTSASSDGILIKGA